MIKNNQFTFQIAIDLFNKMSNFAEYGFNKSHSAAYAYLAYQTAYLKVHYPVQFMAALLSNKMGDLEEVSKYLNECKEMGIEVLPPDVNESEEDFTTKENKIRIGLKAVKNVGTAAFNSIIGARRRYGRFMSLYDFCEKVDLTKVNKRVIESLIKAGAFDSFGYKRKALFNILTRTMDYGLKVKKEKEMGQGLLFEVQAQSKDLYQINGMTNVYLDSKDSNEWDESTLLAYEKETLGFYLSGNPLEKYKMEIKEFATCEIEEVSEKLDGKEIYLAGIISKRSTKKTKKGEIMAKFELEDMTDRIEANVFPSFFAALDKAIVNNSEVIVKGRIDINDNRKQIIVSEIIPLANAAEHLGQGVIVKISPIGLSEEKLMKLFEIVKKHKGGCIFYIDFYYPDKKCVRVKAGEEYKVKPEKSLIEEIDLIFGKSSTFIIGRQ